MTEATIWKFEASLDDTLCIDMPRDAEILHVALQNGIPCIWARVVPDRLQEARHFAWRGTGHPVNMNWRHIGSVLMARDALVFHLFEAIQLHVPENGR